MSWRMFRVIAWGGVLACAGAMAQPHSTMVQQITTPQGVSLYQAKSLEDLLGRGKALWQDQKLSTNGLSCQTCHQGGRGFKPSFATPYPHTVAMAKGMGMDPISAVEMVQLCLVVPMAGKPLPWSSKDLAALTAYVTQVEQKTYQKQKSGSF